MQKSKYDKNKVLPFEVLDRALELAWTHWVDVRIHIHTESGRFTHTAMGLIHSSPMYIFDKYRDRLESKYGYITFASVHYANVTIQVV